MLLRDKLTNLIAESMKAHNEIRTKTLRLIKSELLKAETEDRKAYNESVETKVLLKMVAAHKDSISQFAGREDLIKSEKEELDIIQEFAPKEDSEEDIISYTKEIISEIENVSMRDMGKILPKVKSKYPTATGEIVSRTLKECLK